MKEQLTKAELKERKATLALIHAPYTVRDDSLNKVMTLPNGLNTKTKAQWQALPSQRNRQDIEPKPFVLGVPFTCDLLAKIRKQPKPQPKRIITNSEITYLLKARISRLAQHDKRYLKYWQHYNRLLDSWDIGEPLPQGVTVEIGVPIATSRKEKLILASQKRKALKLLDIIDKDITLTIEYDKSEIQRGNAALKAILGES